MAIGAVSFNLVEINTKNKQDRLIVLNQDCGICGWRAPR